MNVLAMIIVVSAVALLGIWYSLEIGEPTIGIITVIMIILGVVSQLM